MFIRLDVLISEWLGWLDSLVWFGPGSLGFMAPTSRWKVPSRSFLCRCHLERFDPTPLIWNELNFNLDFFQRSRNGEEVIWMGVFPFTEKHSLLFFLAFCPFSRSNQQPSPQKSTSNDLLHFAVPLPSGSDLPPTEISVLADHAKLEPDIEDINFLPTAMFCSKAGGIRKDSGCRKCGGRNVRMFPKKDEQGSNSIGNESSKLRQLLIFI